MRPFKFTFAFLFLISATGWSVETGKPSKTKGAPPAQQLAIAAFRSPAVPFEARLMLTEWREGQTQAEEVRMFFLPPNSYRIEFLTFDGSVRKVVLTDEKNAHVGLPTAEKSELTSGPLQISNVMTDERIENLLLANYTFDLKGADVFIGRPVWILHLLPRVTGKPTHELKIDQATLVVLEQRRFLADQNVGSLTRFSTFEPNKSFAEGVFPISSDADALVEKKDMDLAPSFSSTEAPPEAFVNLPAGFSLSGHRTFEVEGTTANYFTYTDGALPLSVFRTQLPVRFPADTPTADKLDLVVSGSGTGLSSADQILYGKKGEDYFTIIGEVSPDLLHTIADHFQ